MCTFLFLRFYDFSTKSSGEIADCCTYKSKGSDQIKKPQWKNIGGRAYNPSYNKGPKSCWWVIWICIGITYKLQPFAKQELKSNIWQEVVSKNVMIMIDE